MILDSQLNLSPAQAVTATGDTPSTNVYDTGAAHDLGVGEDSTLVVSVNTTFTSAGAPTMQIVLQDSADNASFADRLVGPVVALAGMTAKTELAKWKLPIGLRRYIRVAYRVGVAVYTAGKVDANIVKDPQAQAYYPIGYTVA